MRFGAALSFISKRGVSDGSKAYDLGTPLTFMITAERAKELLESDRSKFRSIGTFDHDYMYLMDLAALGGQQIHALEVVKEKVINEMVGRCIPAAELFKFALKAANDSLRQHFAPGLVAYLSYVIAHDTAGFGPISMLLEDSGEIEEIEINSPVSNIAVYHRRYGRCTTNLRFGGELDFRYTINKMAASSGTELTSANPIIDAQVGNVRIHAQGRPYSPTGGSASMRIGHPHSVGLTELISSGVISPGMLAYLWMALEAGKNIVIAGAPGAGKTTLMSALSSFLGPATRVITIEEDISEIALAPSLTNVVKLRGTSGGRIGFREQIKNALHMRPDALFIGEIRGDEANEVFAGANVGVPFLTTMHSDGDGPGIISRLRSNPMHIEDYLIANLDVSVFMGRDRNGSRSVKSITEYLWGSGGAQPRLLTVASEGGLDARSMLASEVTRTFAEANKVGMQLAAVELAEREKRLKESARLSYVEVAAR